MHPELDDDLHAARAMAKVKRRGLALLLVGLGGFLAWAAWAPVDQALPGSGVLSAAGERKAVQPAVAGALASLEVREGEVVRAGQVLMRLDVAPQRAELEAAQRQQLLARADSERLAALLADAPTLVFSDALQRAAQTGAEREVLAAQRTLFVAQRLARAGDRREAAARTAGLAATHTGRQRDAEQQREQLALVEQQVRNLTELTESGHYPRVRLVDAQRQLGQIRIEGTRAVAEAHSAREALAEAQAATARRADEQRRTWEAEAVETQRQRAVLDAKVSALAHAVAHADVVAPTAGTVVGLAVHAAGAVVQPGQTVLELVPSDDALIVDARFELAAGEKLVAGAPADLHLQSLDRARTPVLRGRVLTVSADRLHDARSGHPYLRVRVAVPEPEAQRLAREGVVLRAGLPVEVFVRLGERSLLAYLVKPLLDRLAHAFVQ